MSTLVLVTALDCKACKGLKNTGTEEAIEKEIAFMENVDMIVITLNSMRDEIDSKYPKNLAKYASWYPIFLLFKTSDWDLGLPEGIRVRAYKGKFEDGEMIYIGGPPASPSRIRDWVKSSMIDLFSVGKDESRTESIEKEVKDHVTTGEKNEQSSTAVAKADDLIPFSVSPGEMLRYVDALKIDEPSSLSTPEVDK